MKRVPTTLACTALALTAGTLVPATTVAQGGCEKRVTFALVEAKTDGCLVPAGDQVWESTDTVRLNGLPLPVAPQTKLVLRGPRGDAPGGSISVDTNISVAGMTLHRGLLQVNLPEGGSGDEKDVRTFSVPAGQKVLGLSVEGSVSLRLGYSEDEQRYSIVRAVVRLPDLLKNGPNQNAGGLSAAVGIRVDDRGVRADAVRVELEHAYIGQVELKNVCLSYVSAGSGSARPCQPPPFGAAQVIACPSGGDQDRWDGSATIVLPTQSRTQIGVFAGLRGGAFGYAGAAVSNLGNNVPLGAGVYLDKVALSVCAFPPPLRISGSGGIRFGPDFNGTQAAYLEAGIVYTDSRPWSLRTTGELRLFGRRVGGGYFNYESSGSIDFGFDGGYEFGGGVSVNGKVDGWVEARSPARFNVSGSARVCVGSKGCASGELVVSSTGLAGCVTLAGGEIPWVEFTETYPYYRKTTKRAEIRAGVGYRWSPAKLDVMAESCDIGPYRQVRAARVAGAQASEETVTLPRGELAVAVRLVGEDAPPRVRLVGPDDRTIEAGDPEGAIEPSGHAVSMDPEEKTTSILIARPAAGRWRIVPLPDSPAIATTSVAETLEPPVAVARVLDTFRRLPGLRSSAVRRKRGRRTRVLQFAVAAQAGSTITFVEEGPQTLEVIGRAQGEPCPGVGDLEGDHERPLCGQLEFTPAEGPGGTRRVYALVQEADGTPIDRILLDSYDAPADEPPGRARYLELRRTGGGVKVRWGDAPHVDSWNLRVRLSDGRSFVVVEHGERERDSIPNVGRTTRVSATIVGLRDDQRQGRALSASLPARRARVRVRGG
jgi:hypothetical protein